MFGFRCVNAGEFFAQGFDIGALVVNFDISCLRIAENSVCYFTDFVFQAFEQVFGKAGLLVNGESHAQTEFGIVFKQGISPSRTVAFFIFGVRGGREVARVD